MPSLINKNTIISGSTLPVASGPSSESNSTAIIGSPSLGVIGSPSGATAGFTLPKYPNFPKMDFSGVGLASNSTGNRLNLTNISQSIPKSVGNISNVLLSNFGFSNGMNLNESEKNRTLDCSYREIWKVLEEEVLHKCLNKSSSKMLIQVLDTK